MRPVRLRCIKVNHQKRYQRQQKSERDIAHDVRIKRREAKEIAQPDKEEYRQQKRHEAVGMMVKVWEGHLVSNEENNRL